METCDTCGKQVKMVKVVWSSALTTQMLCEDCYTAYCQQKKRTCSDCTPQHPNEKRD